MLVQISEPAKGKSRQLEAAIEAGGVLSDAASSIAQGVLSAFDKANQENVASIVGPVFDPSAIPQSTNTGSAGNSGWRGRFCLGRKS